MSHKKSWNRDEKPKVWISKKGHRQTNFILFILARKRLGVYDWQKNLSETKICRQEKCLKIFRLISAFFPRFFLLYVICRTQSRGMKNLWIIYLNLACHTTFPCIKCNLIVSFVYGLSQSRLKINCYHCKKFHAT